MHLPGAYLGEISAMVADGRRTFLIWQVEELGLLADRDDQGVLLQVNPPCPLNLPRGRCSMHVDARVLPSRAMTRHRARRLNFEPLA